MDLVSRCCQRTADSGEDFWHLERAQGQCPRYTGSSPLSGLSQLRDLEHESIFLDLRFLTKKQNTLV